ncbi:MAG: cobaltochelatase subunit CobN [Roseiflexaceae bacterium]
MQERHQRNMVQRLDGRMVNAGMRRGMLFVCATGCCCGHTDRGYAPVSTDLYHQEWERRRLRNKIHLNQGGCLGPCPLANVAMLLLDGRPIWFHSLNDDTLIVALYDYIEALLTAERALPPPEILAPHMFNGFAWDGAQHAAAPTPPADLSQMAGDGIVVLAQADTDLLALEGARALLPPGFPPLRLAQIGRLVDDDAVDRLLDELLVGAGAVVLRLLGGARSFAHGLERLQRWAERDNAFLLCLPGAEALDPELMAHSNVGVPLAHLISAYFQGGGVENLANGLQCLSDHLLLTGWGYDPPRELPRHGVYANDERRTMNDEACACCQPQNRPATRDPRPEGEGQITDDLSPVSCLLSPPTVGVLFYRAHLLSGNTTFVDAIIDELAAQGLRARAVFTQSLKECDEDGQPIALGLLAADGPIDALICTLSFALVEQRLEIGDPDVNLQSAISNLQSPWSQLDVPVIQAIVSSSSRAAWVRSGRGLGPLDTAMNVAIPEFDGRIITVPITFKEQPTDGAGARYVADPERLRRVVGLARRQIALRRTPNAEKRVAFIFTNSSAKAARVGNAVGLDAPASLLRLLQAMHAVGYTVGELPATSDQLLLSLIDRCSYDQIWLTEQQLARAVQLPVERYAGWFAELPEARRDEMTQQWGAPPGRAYIHDGALALAGLELGNMFVALQPPRGYDMDPNAIYHRPDLPPPHNYVALYRWLRDEWRANAIVHVGKHGTLEWLPGKSLGLSADCYPDLLLDELPLIYPFIINDPGEGNQAKRRSHAVIVDHMTPPMTSAGAYGALAELAQLVDEYYQMEQLDPSKLPLLQRQIWDVVVKNRLDDDLRYILHADHGDHSHDWDGAFLDDGTPTAFAELEGRQVAHLLEDIEGYLCELTGAQIRDGLHILGTMPAGEPLVELLYHLLKLPNGDTPSLPESVACVFGEDWQALQAQPGDRRPTTDDRRPTTDDGKILHTNADVIAWMEDCSKALLRALNEQGWQRDSIETAIAAVLYGGPSVAAPPMNDKGSQFSVLGSQDGQPTNLQSAICNLQSAMAFACTQIIPNLGQGAHDEIAHLLHALNGGYIPPGPSGAPTRGMAHVLPTGRNFYAVDPRALPSMAAWQVGQGLADDLIRRHLRETGAYPASVGISIWGTSAMRTAGDDIAQVLALLGVRPRWQPENRRVLGVEVVPLAELGRPRIDVVCRISGFFRDAFPHLIVLLDAASQAVIALDEPFSQNFPRKHALAAEAELLRSGLDAEGAARQARYRVFGCKPGSYGAGILPLIDAGNWRGDADFAQAYLTWGGYAYTGAELGTPARAAFAQALATVQIATKNQDNREHDIFDSDDYLQYHGGMIATIRALTGQNPRRYFGDSSDPAHARTRDLREEARRVFRSRVVNPKWIASMRRHGYKGALELAATVDYLFGYDATAQVLDDWMYHQVADAYLRDEELQQFFADSNPWAWQAIAERLLEAIERGLWQDPDPLDLQLLQAAQAHGLGELRRRQERQ